MLALPKYTVLNCVKQPSKKGKREENLQAELKHEHLKTVLCYTSTAERKKKPSAKTGVWADKLVKGLLGNSDIFYECEVMQEGEGEGRIGWYWWEVCASEYAGGTCGHACPQKCVYKHIHVMVSVWPKLYEFHFLNHTYPSPALTYPYNPSRANWRACVTQLSPDTSQEGRNVNFFPSPCPVDWCWLCGTC